MPPPTMAMRGAPEPGCGGAAGAGGGRRRRGPARRSRRPARRPTRRAESRRNRRREYAISTSSSSGGVPGRRGPRGRPGGTRGAGNRPGGFAHTSTSVLRRTFSERRAARSTRAEHVAAIHRRGTRSGSTSREVHSCTAARICSSRSSGLVAGMKSANVVPQRLDRGHRLAVARSTSADEQRPRQDRLDVGARQPARIVDHLARSTSRRCRTPALLQHDPEQRVVLLGVCG